MKNERSYYEILADVGARLVPLQSFFLFTDLNSIKPSQRTKYLLKVEQDLDNSRKKDIWFLITYCGAFMLIILVVCYMC